MENFKHIQSTVIKIVWTPMYASQRFNNNQHFALLVSSICPPTQSLPLIYYFFTILFFLFQRQNLLKWNVWMLAVLFWQMKPISLSQNTFISWKFLHLPSQSTNSHPKRQLPFYLRLILLVLKVSIHEFIQYYCLVSGFFHSALCFWDSTICVYQLFVFLFLAE